MILEKPRVKLSSKRRPSHRERRVINTITEEDYLELMRVLDCRGIREGGHWSIRHDDWRYYANQTCIMVENFLVPLSKRFCENTDRYILTKQEFYDEEKITQEQIQEINRWFEEQTPYYLK